MRLFCGIRTVVETEMPVGTSVSPSQGKEMYANNLKGVQAP